MKQNAIPTWCFSLVLVRLGRRLLLIQEKKHDQRWYLPAGRLGPGESFLAAARRETLEEAGIRIELEGILRVEHTPLADGTARHRVIFVARPRDDTQPKSHPDEHSLGARWVAVEELTQLPLRDPEVAILFKNLLGGATVHPLSIMGEETPPNDFSYVANTNAR